VPRLVIIKPSPPQILAQLLLLSSAIAIWHHLGEYLSPTNTQHITSPPLLHTSPFALTVYWSCCLYYCCHQIGCCFSTLFFSHSLLEDGQPSLACNNSSLATWSWDAGSSSQGWALICMFYPLFHQSLRSSKCLEKKSPFPLSCHLCVLIVNCC
jgi:hypothetical protein